MSIKHHKNALNSKISDIFTGLHNGCSDDYVTKVKNICNDNLQKYLTVQSGMLCEGKLELIFIDRFNVNFVSKTYDVTKLLNDWEYLKYNITLMQEIISVVINYYTLNNYFTYNLVTGGLVVINAGVENVIILPTKDVYPLLTNLFGTMPTHTLLPTTKISAGPGYIHVPPNPTETDNGIGKTEKPVSEPSLARYDIKYFMHNRLPGRLISVKETEKGKITYTFKDTENGNHEYYVNGNTQSSLYSLYEKYKSQHRRLGQIFRHISNCKAIVDNAYAIEIINSAYGHDYTYVYIKYLLNGVYEVIEGFLKTRMLEENREFINKYKIQTIELL